MFPQGRRYPCVHLFSTCQFFILFHLLLLLYFFCIKFLETQFVFKFINQTGSLTLKFFPCSLHFEVDSLALREIGLFLRFRRKVLRPLSGDSKLCPPYLFEALTAFLLAQNLVSQKNSRRARGSSFWRRFSLRRH